MLVVLAAPVVDEKKSGMVAELCKDYIEACTTRGLEVDLINLYDDGESGEFSPLYYPGEKDTKVLEYQIRIKEADLVTFFCPVWWGSVPAILKSFIEKVFVSGFAYHFISKMKKGLLEGKKMRVYAFDSESFFVNRLLRNNSVKLFWDRGVFPSTGVSGKVNLFTSVDGLNEKELAKLKEKIKKSAIKDIGKNEKLIDLLQNN